LGRVFDVFPSRPVACKPATRDGPLAAKRRFASKKILASRFSGRGAKLGCRPVRRFCSAATGNPSHAPNAGTHPFTPLPSPWPKSLVTLPVSRLPRLSSSARAARYASHVALASHRAVGLFDSSIHLPLPVTLPVLRGSTALGTTLTVPKVDS
jgi:hypothetical protein